ncbi:DUF805 domain-containing protein [Brevundimonas intermedia]|uniref:DUF805 domain-containing protein n=1 Tax=Brevundimonas intermedia TaxID=74315 RepID=UPI0035A658CC
MSKLGDFAGRDGRRLFWPYAILVFLLAFIGIAVAMNLAMMGLLTGTADMPNIPLMIGGVGGVVLAAAALLAAAVTRRLHDTGRPGYWGLPPVVFLLIGLTLFPVLMNRVLNDANPPMALFFGLFLNNLLYIASLIGLVVLLLLDGAKTANRYGSPSN